MGFYGIRRGSASANVVGRRRLRRVRIGFAVAVAPVLGLSACGDKVDTGATSTTTTRADPTTTVGAPTGAGTGANPEALIADCRTQRAMIITAVSAAKVSNEMNSPPEPESWRDYISDSITLTYFEEPVVEATSFSAARLNTETVDVRLCPPIEG